MIHMTTAQADLLLRLADLLDEMEEENIEITPGEENWLAITLDGVTVLESDAYPFVSEDIRSITA